MAKGYLVHLAMTQFLTKEFVGSKHNPEVLKYFDEIGHAWVNDDETPWCSAFMNWCAMNAGLERSAKLDARSWLNVGEVTHAPETGDVCILWRGTPAGWQGHVGIFVCKKEGQVYLLGGNQGDTVCVAPYAESRVLGYRRLATV